MNVTNIKIAETDLASRRSAAHVRLAIESAAQSRQKVLIDFSSVLSLSESYADELFGVLAAQHGLDWFGEYLNVRGAGPAVFNAIAQAVRQRLETTHPDNPDIALLTARKALAARERAV